MKGVRAVGLLAGLLGLAVGVWQIILYAGAPGSVGEWFRFLQSEPMLGKTWGARVFVLLLMIVPLWEFSERAEGGWGRMSRAFLRVWLPLALVAALVQTQPIERLRDLAEPAAGGDPSALRWMTFWLATVEPLSRTAAFLAPFGFGALVASARRQLQWLGVVAWLLLALLAAVLWSGGDGRDSLCGGEPAVAVAGLPLPPRAGARYRTLREGRFDWERSASDVFSVPRGSNRLWRDLSIAPRALL
ncbi:MAG: hypothetical protein KatS3mg115_0861 [Candidatus Poribacteria bacterium]|nr:MAG: hypothetical protein KatS3mg115_0861 [Candidatus Poribacteria bacterium]